MSPAITDTQPKPSTSRTTTTDRDGPTEETGAGLCCCGLGNRWLSRNAAPDPDVAPGRASEFMGTVGCWPLKQRTIQAPAEAAQAAEAAEANKILREILKSRRVSLRLQLIEYPANITIKFDIVERDDCIILKPGTQLPAYYLGEAKDNGWSTIKLPLPVPGRPQDPGAPTYFLMPRLRDEIVCIEPSYSGDYLLVSRRKLTQELRRRPQGPSELKISHDSFMLLPNYLPRSKVYTERVAGQFHYRHFPELGQRKNEAPDNLFGEEVILWGQLEEEFYIGEPWCLSLQHNAAEDGKFEIVTFSTDGMDGTCYSPNGSTLVTRQSNR